MKHIIPALTFLKLANSQIIPDESSWKINCQTITSPSTQPGPAFTAVQDLSNGQYNIIWSSFSGRYGAIAGNGNYGSNSDGSFCDANTNSSYTQIAKNGIFGWPNGVKTVPEAVLGSSGYLIVADGFATPTTYDGCIAIIDTNGNQPAAASDIQFVTSGCGQDSPTTTYFYHYVEFVDMDNDGDLDILTARASSKTNPTDLDPANLVWYQNPGTGFSASAEHWTEYVIESSNLVCDTGFDILTYNSKKYVVCGGFGSGILAVFSADSTNPSDDWTQTSTIQADIISPAPADNGNFYFSQTWHDMNNDGIPDAIITIGSYGINMGKLLVYPGSDVNGVLTLTEGIMVYDQFPVYSSSLGSPGEAFPFYYNVNDEENMVVASIMVSGDDDGNMYMFDPTGYTDPMGADFNWEYNMETIMKTDTKTPAVLTPLNAPTVGQPSVVDLNGDGCNDIVVPSYALQELIFLELKNTRNCQHNSVAGERLFEDDFMVGFGF